MMVPGVAAGVVNTVPLVLLFVCTQKCLVEGVQFGAVTGRGVSG